MNPHDDGIGIDEYVDWLIEAGYQIERIADFSEWVSRFHTALRALPEQQRQNSVLQMLQMLMQATDDLHAPEPTLGSYAPARPFPRRGPRSQDRPRQRQSGHPTHQRTGHRQIRHRPTTPRPALTYVGSASWIGAAAMRSIRCCSG